MNEERESPRVLWLRAHQEHPSNPEERTRRYLELMREAGHIVPADHPDAGPKNLPCGYPEATP